MFTNFLEELRWRELLQSHTEGLDAVLNNPEAQPVRGYIGFDPTAPSLGIGNYVQIATLRRFQEAGHQPVVLLGGATGRIGDPSGKDQERSLLSLDTLERNIAAQTAQFAKFLDFSPDRPNRALLVNNWDFYKDMNALEFLRDVGKYLTVNYMMAKDSVKNRIQKEEGISFTEFSYQLIQGYDFVKLQDSHQCSLQMGGGDQWGNITTGIELIRKIKGGKAHGLCTKLLTKKDGKKFGKSEAGNLFLDAALTSPYTFYQYWMGSEIADDDLPTLYRVLSFRSRAEIEQLERDLADNPQERRKLLAEELTRTIHDEATLERVQQTTSVVFNAKLSPEFLRGLSPETWAMIARELPNYALESAEPVGVLDLLAEKTGFFPSKGEARRAIQAGSVAINAEKITEPSAVIDLASFLLSDGYLLLRNGKKCQIVTVNS